VGHLQLQSEDGP